MGVELLASDPNRFPNNPKETHWVSGYGLVVRPTPSTDGTGELRNDFFPERWNEAQSYFSFRWATVRDSGVVADNYAIIRAQEIPSWSREGKRLSAEDKRGYPTTITRINDHQYVIDGDHNAYVIEDGDGAEQFLKAFIQSRGGTYQPSYQSHLPGVVRSVRDLFIVITGGDGVVERLAEGLKKNVEGRLPIAVPADPTKQQLPGTVTYSSDGVSIVADDRGVVARVVAGLARHGYGSMQREGIRRGLSWRVAPPVMPIKPELADAMFVYLTPVVVTSLERSTSADASAGVAPPSLPVHDSRRMAARRTTFTLPDSLSRALKTGLRPPVPQEAKFNRWSGKSTTPAASIPAFKPADATVTKARWVATHAVKAERPAETKRPANTLRLLVPPLPLPEYDAHGAADDTGTAANLVTRRKTGPA